MAGFVLFAALALAGCSPDADHNPADVTFAQRMIPHHRQALTMSEKLPSDADAPVTELARRIQAAQAPEIDRLTGWLKEWGAFASGHEGMDHGMAPGTRAEWLKAMIEHHRGAVTMARDELRDGAHVGAKQLAQAIIDGQEAEIATMTKLLG
ncbi:DUF305 domain-containing protein [Amycolatopsis sp. NPDC059657]|uniref:DUF305 domain-containing protein n=1 Tax=Amycolatopsis sp. NPDC059657 TaxID=3346899 RepID=UPI00366B08EB